MLPDANSRIDQKLEFWKTQLLEKSATSPMVNLRDTLQTLKITYPSDIGPLYDDIVNNDIVFEFPLDSTYRRGDDLNIPEFTPESYTPVDSSRKVLYASSSKWKSNNGLRELRRSLRMIRSRTKTNEEETGLHNLFLTFGSLMWYESESSDIKRKSPILIVPVNLIRYNIKDPFLLEKNEEEAFVNPILESILKNDFGISLPPFNDEEFDLKSYLNMFESVVAVNSRWSVLNECYLSPLSFRKIVIYKDLESNKQLYKEHPLITKLAGINYDSGNDANFFYESIDLDAISPKSVFQVLDADSSQQDAIEFAKQGKSFVLEGPPGTGKSQTITNIIVELLGNDKKILFVAEKMAALEVVASRIKKVGLIDYALILQSKKEKARRKQLVDNLMKCFSSESKTENGEIIDKYFRTLEAKKRILNTYVQQLHEIIPPLGMSMYQVHGRLVRLNNVQHVISLDTRMISNFSKNDLHAAKEELTAISSISEKLHTSEAYKYWKEHEKLSLTLRLREEISMHARELVDDFKSLEQLVQKLKIKLGFSTIRTIEDLLPLRHILNDLRDAKPVVEEWLYQGNLSKVGTQIESIIRMKEDLQNTIQEASDFFGKDFLRKPFQEFLSKAEALENDIKQSFGVSSLDRLPSLSVLKNWLGCISDIYTELVPIITTSSTIYPGLKSEEMGKIVAKAPQFLIWPRLVQIPAQWLENPLKFRRIKKAFLEAKGLYDASRDLELKIKERGDGQYKGIDWISHDKWLETHTSFTSTLGPAYKRIKLLVQKFTSSSHNKQEIAEILHLLAKYQETAQTIAEQHPKYQDILGEYLFDGGDTDWQYLNGLIDDSEAFFASNKHGSPVSISSLILEKLKENVGSGIDLSHNLATSLESLHKVLSECPGELDPLKLKLISSDISLGKQTLRNAFDAINAVQDMVDSLHLHNEPTATELFENVERLKQLLNQKKAYENLGALVFSNLGLQTNWKIDWPDLLAKVVWADKISQTDYRDFVVSSLGNRLYSADNEFVSHCSAIHERLVDKLQFIEGKSFKFFTRLFKDKSKWMHMELADAIVQIDECRKNISILEDSIKLEDLTSENRISPLVKLMLSELRQLDVEPMRWVDIFLKSFFTQWRDSQIEGYAELNYFSAEDHLGVVKEFKQLDVDQLAIAARRVKHLLDSRRPDESTAFGGEVAIIKKESMKKRKFMSIRRLLNEIPTLILDMKPCFLMSPLAVSQYLRPEFYKFDTVIFDEASQIKTHDAISSILRGKQVIIVGDTKQLPPTSFFETSDSEDEFDTIDDDEEEDLNETYESVLQEASLLMPSLTLRWHYRSKFEHLIMFSNSEFYQNKLITFPSQTYSEKHAGVEHVYVPDGIYDRGKSRRNLKEAEKAVDLIFEHFKNFPNRSLGIVTCSQSQQHCIEDTLEKRREDYPDFEQFFLESVEEPFFIKNIETVQGDERDTIFFCVGYGPSTLGGTVPMNFGPINRIGGEKRLNVAITRARENLRVVSSFHAVNINSSNSTSVGAKKLLAFLQYAEQGIDSLSQSVVNMESLGETESPFEDSVKDFLESEGYQVVPQVGCSQYRIDLGIIHPSHAGVYAAGIECDGAQYHSSRTTRERDRLRQDVLERMGWKIIRVWSTDWLKNPFEARKRLKDEVEKSITHNVDSNIFIDDPGEPVQTEIRDLFVDNEQKSHDMPETASIESIQLHRLPDFKDFEPSAPVEKIEDILSDLEEYLKFNQPITLEYLIRVLRKSNVEDTEIRDLKKNPREHLSKQNLYIDQSRCIWYSKTDVALMAIPKRNDGKNLRETTDTICNSEIIGLVYVYVNSSYGPTIDEIVEQYKQVFSFKRAGSGIKKSIEKAISVLLKRELVVEREGKFFLGPGK
ncbi:MAG: DUF4011 domain-containing protein [Sphaerochaetaceae bacterium]